MPRKIGLFFDSIVNFFAYTAFFLMVVIVALMAANVFLRYFLNQPISGAEQLVEYLIAAIGYWSAAWVLKREGHVTMDFLLIRLRTRARAALNLVTSIVCLMVCLIILYGGATNIFWYWERGITAADRVIELPLSIVMSIMPIGFLILAIQFVRRAKEFYDITRGRVEEEKRKVTDISELGDRSDI